MEKNSRYAVVGLFVIVSIIALGLFAFWLGKYGFNKDQYFTYKTYVNESIDGLKKSAQVSKGGIEIGFVEQINFDQNNDTQIEIILKIQKTAPIKEDDFAILSQKGIAGTSFIDIKGGTRKSKLLKDVDKSEIPTIASAPSFMKKITNKLEIVVDKFSNIVSNIEKITDNKNINNIQALLENINQISKNLKNQKEILNSFLDSSNNAVIEFRQTINNTNELINEAKNTANQSSKILSQINDKNLTSKIEDTLLELNKTIAETNLAINEVKQGVIQSQFFIKELEESPSDLIFKSKKIELGPGE